MEILELEDDAYVRTSLIKRHRPEDFEGMRAADVMISPREQKRPGVGDVASAGIQQCWH